MPFTWQLVLDILETDNKDAMELEVARLGGDLKTVLRPVDAPDGKTIVHAAVENGAKECLKFLIIKMSSELELDEPDQDGRTPLHYAVELGYLVVNPDILECMELLLSHGAYVNARDKFGDTALHNVAQMSISDPRNNSDCFLHYVDLLLSQRDIDLFAKNGNNQKPLDIKKHFSDLKNGSCPKYKMIQNKAEKCTTDITTRSLLYNAVYSVAEINQKTLSEKLKESIPNAFIGTKSILFHVVQKMNVSIVKKILSNGFNPWMENVDDHKIPLHAALTRGNAQIVAVLLEHMKSSPESKLTDLRPLSFELLRTVLCNASRPGKVDEDSKVNHLKCLQLLMAKDVLIDVNATDGSDEQIRAIGLADSLDLQKFTDILKQHRNKIEQGSKLSKLCSR